MNTQRTQLLRRIGLATLAMMLTAMAMTTLFALLTAQMGSLFFALIAGSLGAEISLIRRFPKLSDSEVSTMVASWWGLLVPLMAGAIMAGFLYMAFMAGMLTGDGGKGLFTSNLFPSFSSPAADGPLNLRIVLEIRPQSVMDFGKLVAWCFLSGYSERLVPSLLQSLENRGGGADKSAGN